MKTTELIPIILYQLVDGDRYGYEIVKQIEDSSNGGIVIKQPTLYSVLKKLEQGRFISSYWQDSEIGGKRHYYKLTDNGKAQLDTYPPFDTLIKEAMEGEGLTFVNTYIQTKTKNTDDLAPALTKPIQEEELNTAEVDSIEESHIKCIEDTVEVENINVQLIENTDINSNDAMLVEIEEITPTPIDLTSPISNNFNEVEIKPIDLGFDMALDKAESDIQIEDDTPTQTSYINIFDAIEYNDETPSVNEEKGEQKESEIVENVSLLEPDDNQTPKFTEKVDSIEEPYVVNKLYDKLSPNEELINEVNSAYINEDIDASSPTEPIETIKYINYIDLATDQTVLKQRKAVNKRIQKMTITCVTLLLTLLATLYICSKYSFSKLYYIAIITVTLILVLYPITLISRIPKIRYKYCTRPFIYSTSRDFFIKLSLFLTFIITIFAYNLNFVQNVADIFKMSNFASFGAPIMFSLVVMLDFVYSALFYKQYTK